MFLGGTVSFCAREKGEKKKWRAQLLPFPGFFIFYDFFFNFCVASFSVVFFFLPPLSLYVCIKINIEKWRRGDGMG